MPQIPGAGERKTGAQTFELDKFGVELVPYDVNYRTNDDVVKGKHFVRVPMADGSWQSHQVHYLRHNFPGRMSAYYKFLRGEEPARTDLLDPTYYEEFLLHGVADLLQQMEQAAPGLHHYFDERSKRLARMRGIYAGSTALRSQIADAPDFDFQGEDDAMRRELLWARNSSGYAFLAPRVIQGSHTFLNN